MPIGGGFPYMAHPIPYNIVDLDGKMDRILNDLQKFENYYNNIMPLLWQIQGNQRQMVEEIAKIKEDRLRDEFTQLEAKLDDLILACIEKLSP